MRPATSPSAQKSARPRRKSCSSQTWTPSLTPRAMQECRRPSACGQKAPSRKPQRIRSCARSIVSSRRQTASLVSRKGGDDFEHDQRPRRERGGGERRACGQRRYAEAGKPGGVDHIHGFEVLDVREQQCDLDDVSRRATRRVQNRVNVRQHPACLCFESLFKFAGGRVSTRLCGYENEIARANGLRVRAGGGWGRVSFDPSLVNHLT